MVKRAYINPKPTGTLHPNAPADAVKIEFARRLQAAITAKGWRQSDLARHALQQLPKGRAFGRDSVSLYIRGRSLPGPLHLDAMAKALGVKPEDLMPTRGVPSAGENNPALNMQDLGDGHVWLRVNQAVPWDAALEIMNLIKRPVKT